MGEVVPYIAEAMIQGVDNKPKPKRVLVLAPAIMVEKWAREIKERIPGCETFIIQHYTDVQRIQKEASYVADNGKIRYREPQTWEYYIISSETPKATYPMDPIRDWRLGKASIDELVVDTASMRTVRRGAATVEVANKNIRTRVKKVTDRYSREEEATYTYGPTGYYCPKCGNPLTRRNKEVADNLFFDTYNKKSDSFKKKRTEENWVCTNKVNTKHLPKSEIKKWTLNRVTNVYEPTDPTQACGFVLWQPEKLAPTSKQRKVSPAWYINKKLPRGFFKYLIADEVHEYKSGDSSIGKAFGQLVNHTEKQILLTGTLMGGMSKDIFYLLARLNPKGLLKEGIRYDNESLFTNRYGVNEFSTRSNDGNLRRSKNQKPGISPHLFPMHLMGNCAFLELNDMGYALPRYEEIPVVVDMDEQHRQSYDLLSHDILSSMRRIEGMGGMSGVSVFMNAMYQYADAPFNMTEIAAHDMTGTRHVLAEPYCFNKDSFIPTKVAELIRTIENDLNDPEPLLDKEGNVQESPKRRSLVYVKHTGKDAWNVMDTYLYDLLKARGLNVGILRNGASYDGIKMPKSSQQREEWLHEMMEKHDWDVLITNPRLVKVGLDLLDFPNIHFFQLDYSTYDYMQASRRSWRLKQTLPVKVYTYVYRNTIQDKALQHIARKIDAAMAMQGKFSEEGLRAMADSGDGMNAIAKQLMSDNVLEEIETVHDMFARKNSSFEEMQSVEFQEYDGYVMNPIEGGMETVRQIAQGLIRFVEEEVQAGRATPAAVEKTRAQVNAYLDLYEAAIKPIEDVTSYNKGLTKQKKVIEGQQAFDLFAL